MVLVTKGTAGGDLFPFLRIGRALKARGHEAVVVSHWYFEEYVRDAGLDFAALNTPEELPHREDYAALDTWRRLGREGAGLTLAPSHTAASGDGPGAAARLSIFGLKPEMGLAEFEAIGRMCREPDTVLVANYLILFAARPVAEKLGVPYASVFLSPGAVPTWVMGLPFFDELYRHVGADLNRVREAVGLAPVEDWRTWLGSGDLMLGMWPDWFAPPRPEDPFPVLPVGFTPDEPDGDAGEIPGAGVTEAGERAILIAHGTSIPFTRDFFSAAAEACRLLDHPGLLVSKYEEVIPAELPARVRWIKYAPFAGLMPRVGAVVHHGGIGTARQALVAGVPQLALNVNHEGAGNIERLESLGVAESLSASDWRPEPIAGALRRLLGSPDVRRRCAELAGRIGGADSAGRAAELIERLLPSRGFVPRPAPATAHTVARPRLAAVEGGEVVGRWRERMQSLSPEQREELARKLRSRRGR